MYKTILASWGRAASDRRLPPADVVLLVALRRRYGKEALRRLYKTILGRQGVEEGVTPDWMREELVDVRHLAPGTPEFQRARFTLFRV